MTRIYVPIALMLISFVLTLPACSQDGALYEGACTISTDDDDDGVVDSIQRRSYNAAGDPLTDDSDDDNDGVVDRTVRWTYDTDGNLLTQATDSDADGVVDTLTTNEYDAAGQRISLEQQTAGVVTKSWIYTYHANAEMASMREDQDGDGTWDYESLYDEAGLLIQWGWDSDGDDVVDKGRLFEYGPGGLLQFETAYFDAMFGEQANSETTYLYDSGGFLLSVESFNFYQDQISGLETHTWNSDHTVEDIEIFRNPNDPAVATEHREYDLNGNLTHEAPDMDGDGVFDYVNVWDWEGENLLETSQDTDGDGVWDFRANYRYNSDGWVIEIQLFDAPVDGSPSSVVTIDHDKWGNEVRRTEVTQSSTSVTTYDYACW